MEVLIVEQGRLGQYNDNKIRTPKRKRSNFLHHGKEEGSSNGKRISKKRSASSNVVESCENDFSMDELEEDEEIMFLIKARSRKRRSVDCEVMGRDSSKDERVKYELRNTTSKISSSSPPSSSGSSCTSKYTEVLYLYSFISPGVVFYFIYLRK